MPLMPNGNSPDGGQSSGLRSLPEEDDQRFIYDQWELALINNPKSGRRRIPYTKRYRGPR